MYSLVLSCGKMYSMQTGRFLSKQVCEHDYNVNKVGTWNVVMHCCSCNCVLLFYCHVVKRHLDKAVREFIEMAQIPYLQDGCVSCPSMAFTIAEV